MAGGDETQATQTPTGGGERARDARTEIPAKLGRYTVLRLLGRGGVGAVYEAEDPEVGRKVAIKVLREDKDGDTEALRGEAQALGRLVHPNVVTIHDVGFEGGDVFIVMQLVEGETMDKWVAARSVTPAQVLAMFEQAGRGLAAAHAAGLVHCDFKPSNVLVDRNGVVRVSDFGLARAMQHRAAHDAIASASTTSIQGTPAYMAPEQFDGRATAASDQFAFCVSLWEVLAGERPFEDSSIHAEDIAAARGPRRQLPRSSRIPPHVATALARGLAEDPADRFPSMEELLAALEPPPRRSRAPLYAGIAVAVIAAGALVAWRVTRKPAAGPWAGADLAQRRQLTKGACDDSPVIDGATVVFGRTVRDEVDLYAVPLAGGEPIQLTRAATWEWRPNKGPRPGQITHLVHDAKTAEGAQIAQLDLESKNDYAAAALYAWDAITVGDMIAYSPDEPGGIRRVVESRDLAFLDPPPTHSYMLLSASPAGDKLVVTETTANDGPTHPCVVDIATKAVTCLPTRSSDGRAAFGADGDALYFAAADGIRRRDLPTGAETVIVPDVWSEGGVAIAPGGSALVYSTCEGQNSVLDVATSPPTTIAAGPDARGAVVSASGMTVWVHDVRGVATLVGRMPDGRELQLTDVAFGSVRGPQFSPDGTKLVFAASAPNPGIHTLRLSNPGAPHQVTADGADSTPVWTPSGLIGFSRGDATTNHVFVVSADGGAPKQLGSSSRTVYGGRGNELLVDTGDSDAGSLRWIDVTSGAERPGPQRPLGYIKAMATSPDGAWIAIAIGFNGQDLWRIPADGTPEHVFAYSPGITTTAVGITNDGHVLATQQVWTGDLFVVPARSGHAF